MSSCIRQNDVKSGCVHVMFDGVGGRVGRGPYRTRRKPMQTRLTLRVVLFGSSEQCNLASYETT